MPQSSHKPHVNLVLGSTNTGKTHFAIEKMLTHKTGVIGLPLRLLAREVFDKVVKRVGPSQVALITGEERIVPNRTCYWVCTTESMPTRIGADFLAVDEIQLCTDQERGHIFTDRLLHARGQKETLFLGAESIRQVISNLLDNVSFESRDRFSPLTYIGKKDTARLEPRTAIVGFSLRDVYQQAETIRRLKGGAAIVTGGLSPRTRNAQVGLYQNGEVNYLVATDAIGMGLNLEIDHIAFCKIKKFDGRRNRKLAPMEMGQIAGRAGRYKNPGTFGILKGCDEIHPSVVDAIENSRYKPIKKIQWRNADLDYRSPKTLLKSLNVNSSNRILERTGEIADIEILEELIDYGMFPEDYLTPSQVQLLWEVCQIPDFKNVGIVPHSLFVSSIFNHLKDGNCIPEDWLGEHLERIDSVSGSIESLSSNLASIRIWTYIAQKQNWVDDTKYWRERTRDVEDRLSDALHQKLTNRFIDVKVSVLIRKISKKEQLVPEFKDDGGIEIEGQNIGKVEGFRFFRNLGSTPDEEKAFKEVTKTIIEPQFSLLANKMVKAPNKEFDITEQGGLMWGEHAVGKLVKGADPYSPKINIFVDKIASEEVKQNVQSRLENYVEIRIKDELEQLLKLKNDTTLEGDVRDFALKLCENFGILPRNKVSKEVANLDQEKRRLLRAYGVRFGQYSIFEFTSVKPYPTRLRLILWSLQKNFEEFPPSPPFGLTSLTQLPEAPEGYFPICGFKNFGSLAIRVDILERLMNLLRVEDSKNGFGPSSEMLSITGLSHELFSEFMKELGYKVFKEEKEKLANNTPDLEVSASSEMTEADSIAKGSEIDQDKAKTCTESPEAVLESETSVTESPEDLEKEAKSETSHAEDTDRIQEVTDANDEVQEKNEVVYTYKWIPKKVQTSKKFTPRKGNNQGGKNQGFKGKKDHKSSDRFNQNFKSRDNKKPFSNRRKDSKPNKTRHDPNHPFSALLEIRDKL